MSKIAVASGDRLNVTLAAATTSGTALLIGTIIGVAVTSGAIGDVVAHEVEGVFELPKLTTDVVTQGAKLYWDNTNKRLTVTASGNTEAGVAYAAADGAATTVLIKLKGR